MPQAAGFVIGALGLGGGIATAGAVAGTFAFGVAAGAGAGLVTTLAIRLATTVALSALSRALAPRPQQVVSGVRTDTTLSGGTNPESFILGRFATAGAMVCPPMSHGTVDKTPNAYLNYVIELSGIPGAELDGILINGEEVPILDASPHASYGKRLGGRYEGRAWIRWHDGSQIAADAMLLAKYPAPHVRPWSAGMVGRGIPYMVLTFRFDREVFQSFPVVKAVVKGARLYDPRADSTRPGGSGSQRWASPATWGWSQNPAVMIYNILRGITLPSGDTWGGAIAAEDLPGAIWAEAMDACDAAVTISGGDPEPAFTAGLEVMVSDEPFSIIATLLDACNGQLAERGGIWSIRIGGPALPVLAIEDDDLLADAADDFRPFPPLTEVWNAIEATWTDPGSAWEARAAAPLANATWEAEDGGRRLSAAIDLPAVTRGTQAARLMATKIADHRRMRVHSLTLPQDAAGLDVLDTLIWTSEINGYMGKLFEVRSMTLGLRTGRVQVTLREVDAADFDPPEVARPEPPDLTPMLPDVQAVPGWLAEPVVIRDGEAAARRPAIRLSWDAEALEDARGLRIAMRLDGQGGDGSEIALAEARAGAFLWAEALPGEAYQFRARAVVDRPTEWSAWAAVTAPDVRIDMVELGGDLAGFFSTVPARVTGLDADSHIETLPGGGQVAVVVFTWSAAAGAQAYEVGITPAGESETIALAAGLSHSLRIAPATGLSVRVRGVSRAGERGPWATSITLAAATDDTAPATPTGLSGLAGADLAWLSWDANAEADLAHYELFQALAATPPPEPASSATHAVSGLQVAIEGLAPETTHHFWLRAVDTSGNRSAWTPRLEVTTPAGAAIRKAEQIADAIITDAKIANLSAAKLVAGTALAASLSVDGTALGTIATRAADPAARVNAGSTKIDPGRITIDGGTTLADWRGLDRTTIAGGRIETGSITAEKLVIRDGSGNLLVNGDFRFGDLRGWSNVDAGLAVEAREAGAPGSTLHAAPMPHVLVAPDDGAAHEGDALEHLPVLEDDTFTLSFLAAGDGATIGFDWEVRIDWLDASGAPLGASDVQVVALDSTDWEFFDLQFAAPAGAVELRRLCIRRAGGGNGASYLAALTLRALANADTLVLPGSITTPLLAAGWVKGERISGSYVDIDGVLTLQNGGALLYGKASVKDDQTDGLYFGRDADGEFGIAFSRLGPSDKLQSIKLSSEAGLILSNARHVVRAPGSGGKFTKTTNMVKTAIKDANNRTPEFIQVTVAIGGGQSGAYGNGSGTAGGATQVKLYDGATLKHTYTANGGYNSGPRVRSDGFSAYGQGGLGTKSKGGVKGADGSAAAINSFAVVDISGWADPQMSITIGAGGVKDKAGSGTAGMVEYTVGSIVDQPADVIPLIPTAAGTIAKSGLSVPFPDLGAGLWVLGCTSTDNIDIGMVEIAPGVEIHIRMGTSCTFVSSQTPVRKSGGYNANRTIGYAFYSMGSWAG